MKKILITLLLASLHLNALSLIVNSASGKANKFSILHIINDRPFSCLEENLAHGKKSYTCEFDTELITDIPNQESFNMDIKFVKFDDGFELVVLPKQASYMRTMDEALFNSVDVISKEKNLSKHWVIITYDDIGYMEMNKSDGINFPIEYHDFLRPSVGALDLNGAPIEYAGTKDINIFLDIKRSYDYKQYDAALEKAQEATMLYPNSIFKSEFLLYKIRALDKVLTEDKGNIDLGENDLIADAKFWINNSATEESIPEVLMYIVKSYIKMGFPSESSYFLDILLTEYPANNFTKMAIIYYADSLYAGAKRTEALNLYNDILYSSNDLDVASEAAIRLAKNSIDHGKINEAKEYMLKILSANSKFLLDSEEQKVYELAVKFADNGIYDIAAQIVQLLYETKTRSDDLYEDLLKDTAIWYAKAKEVKLADEYLKLYMQQFQNGEFTQQIQQASDELFFELSETDNQKLKDYYDLLMERYNNEISEKALVEKMKILYEEKSFSEVLDLEEKVKNIVNAPLLLEANEVLRDSASEQSNIYFRADDCVRAVHLIEKFELQNIQNSDEKYYECMMRGSRFAEAKNEALRHIQNRDLRVRLSWLERLSKVMLSLGDYDDVVRISDDILSLGVLVKNPQTKEILYDKFDALIRAKREQDALGVAEVIESEFVNSYKNVDVFDKIVTFARARGNDLLVEIYAKKMIEQQKRSSVFVRTPQIELDLINSLQRLNKIQEAYNVVEELKSYYNAPSQEIEYYGGELSLKLENIELSREYFGRCAAMDGAWKSVCEQSLTLIR